MAACSCRFRVAILRLNSCLLLGVVLLLSFFIYADILSPFKTVDISAIESANQSNAIFGSRATTPPRGWNSYDSFSWIISEHEFLGNAEIVSQKLLRFGYQYVVVDFGWYRKREKGASVTHCGGGLEVLDEWGRPLPDPARWPSSVGGKGFKPIADIVHGMGLKFGIHVMRGISSQAVQANTPIMGSQGLAYVEAGRIWRARDIALKKERCGWMPECFMSVDTTLGAGRAFLRELDRPILYSISPGRHATPQMALKISSLVNMYRVTADHWDSWKDLKAHFDVSRDFAVNSLIGAQGLLGRSWPDLDMFPLGWLTNPDVNEGPHRSSSLILEEQKTQMTLWAMAKSPLMFGGDLRHIDNATLTLITNPTLLRINAYSTHNQEIPLDNYYGVFQQSKQSAIQIFWSLFVVKVDIARTWIAYGPTCESYIAFFNLGQNTFTLSIRVEHIIQIFRMKNNTRKHIDRENEITCSCFDVWGNKDLGVISDTMTLEVPSHGSILILLKCI